MSRKANAELLKEFQKTVVSCKNVEFTIFGLSLAAINTIISFVLSVITFKIFFNYEKNKTNRKKTLSNRT